MSFPVQITYRGLEPSERLNRLIRSEAAKLEKFFDGIVSCRALVESLQGHHHAGPLFHVRLNVVVPGADLAVDAEPERDLVVGVRDTFRRARRRVQEYAERRSAPHGR
jgi:Sigma 54 modulation protein / S30EA ribosomal protein